MKKGYIKPDAEYINLTAHNRLMNSAGGAGSGSIGSSEFDEDDLV